MNQIIGNNSQKRILAVDDSAIVLTRISDTLRNDYDVTTVNSGVRALKYIKEEKPDLILLDIQMAPINGIETLQKIRDTKGCEDIPVIMLTGMEDKDTVMESAKFGICNYLLKPFNPDELLKRIRQVFDQRTQKSMKLF